MTTLLSAAAVLLAFGLSALLSAWLVRAPQRPTSSLARILDHPNARSLHCEPTPRTGGLALATGFGAGLLLVVGGHGWPDTEAGARLFALVAAALVVGSLSFLDDWRELPRRYRLLGQLGGALLLVAAGLRWDTVGLPGSSAPLPSFLTWPLSLLLIVWMINLYNFMDGMDGLAASMAVFGFGALGWLGASQGDWLFALLNGLVVAAALGFLTANFPPARLFMGDSGSALLGLFAASLSLWGARDGLFPLWVAGLAFSPFILDATWTLLRRAFHGERIWEAHRSHHYQRLVLAGWSHRQTLMRALMLMAAAAACAVAAPRLAPAQQWALMLGWAGIYGIVHYKVKKVERAAASLSDHLA